ncbi:MAG: hypothetical protein H7Z14_05815, partial [Anaerolineae bacterium]|nr:hypothetical protein [Phycisphaerae bacterium]
MKRRNPANHPWATQRRGNVARHAYACEALEQRLFLSAVSWINAAGGAWTTPANWSNNAVPSVADDVTINLPGTYAVTGAGSTINSLVLGAATGTQTLNVSATLSIAVSSTVGSHGAFVLSSGTLSGAGTLSISGTFDWSGGSMVGSGMTIIAAAATATISSAATKYLDSGTLQVNGTANYTGSGLVFASNGTLNVGAGGVFNFADDGNLAFFSSPAG